MKTPAIVRGIIIGMLIQIIGVMPLFALISKNIEILPSFPWALFIGLIWIWIIWRFLTGKKTPFPASEKRKELSRSEKMNGKTIKWIFFSGFLLSITLLSLTLIGYQFTKVPLQQLDLLIALNKIPLWTSISLLFIASLITGVVEELAFRGYMQKIIELKHKPYIAITIVALVFTVVHFLPLIIWPLFFLGSLGWGILAYYSKSVVPGIVFHSIIDFSAFVWFFFNTDTLKEILEYSIFISGVNTFFIILLAIALISTTLTILSFIKLKHGYNILYK